ILAFTILVDYFVAMRMEFADKKNKLLLLVGCLVVNIGVLAFFKYYNFANRSLNSLFEHVFQSETPFPYLAIILPLGLSFHTFQALSYVIEVYRGHQKAEKHFGM